VFYEGKTGEKPRGARRGSPSLDKGWLSHNREPLDPSRRHRRVHVRTRALPAGLRIGKESRI
jgi:hypothetical protein